MCVININFTKYFEIKTVRNVKFTWWKPKFGQVLFQDAFWFSPVGSKVSKLKTLLAKRFGTWRKRSLSPWFYSMHELCFT